MTMDGLGSVLVLVISISVQLSHGHECDLGIYGPKCDKKCGHCIGGPVFCDVLYGFCMNGCSWGYRGPTCEDVCPPKFYGYNCESSCSANCKNESCNPRTGECSSLGCEPGYSGKFCLEACPDSTYGEHCSRTCYCPLCGCDPIFGTCYTECPKEEDESLKIEEAQGSTIDPTQTKMVCREMEDAFRDIIEKLSQTYPVPMWPLFIIISIILVVFAIKIAYDLIILDRNEKYRQNWQQEYFERQKI